MKRSLELDVLRGIAVLLVVGYHTWPIYRRTSAVPFWNALQMGGWAGVDLFFVLSGFLIGGLLFAEYRETGSVRAGRFLIRRGFKIYPAFWVALAVWALIPIFEPRPTLTSFLAELLYFQNYNPGILGVSWSLAVEEHFYLLLALLVFLLTRRKGGFPLRAIPRIALILGALCLVLRLAAAVQINEFSPYIHFYPTHLRLDALSFGVMLTYYFHFHADGFRSFARRYRYLLLILGVLLFYPAFWLGQSFPLITTVGLTSLYLGSGAFLVALTSIRLPAPFRILGLVGRYSYSIYLWHIPVEILTTPYLKEIPNENVGHLLYVLLSLAAGILMGRLIEIPVLKFRDKKFPSKQTSPTPVEAGAPANG